jgi:predicted flap endonuclease-1-like 5' DNA nuclease
MSVLGIIGDILSIFGLGSSRSDRQKSNGSSDTDVRIERESGDSEAATESEAAVKGTDESPEHEADEEAAEDEAEAEDEEPVASETDAAASTASMADESGESEVAEEAEATGVTDHAGTEEEAAEPAEAAGPVPTEPEAGEEPVDSVSGIGPAYAKRLNEAGVESVTDLLEADAAEVADETGISEKRVRGWQDAAE